MNFETLEMLLVNCPVTFLTFSNTNTEFHIAARLDSAGTSLLPHVLYCCSLEIFQQLRIPENEKDFCFLLLTDALNIPDANNLTSESNILFTYDRDFFDRAPALITDALLEEKTLQQQHTALLDMIIRHQSLTKIADEISRIYEHYIDIIDNSMNILAISENAVPPNERLLDDHKNRLVLPNVISYLRISGNLSQMQKSNAPVIVRDDPREIYAYSVPIQGGANLILGYLCVFIQPDEQLSPLQVKYLSTTARYLSIAFQNNNIFQMNKATYFTHLLNDILKGIPSMAASYEERFKAFNYDLRKWKTIAVLQLNTQITSDMDISMLAHTVQKLCGNCIYVIHSSFIVYLISETQMNPLLEELTLAGEYLQSNQLYMGVSSPFVNISDAPESFNQAKSAITLGQQYNHSDYLYFYDSLRLLDIADRLSQDNNLDSLLFPPLLRLIHAEKSADNTHSLVKTLYCYLINGQSVNRTCQALFIHRNTLYYRLDKIKEITGCDLTHPDDLTQIYLSFVFLRYQNRFYWND